MAYDKFPKISVDGLKCSKGYQNIVEQVTDKLKKKKCRILTIDCYPGIRYSEILNGLIEPCKPELILFADDFLKPQPIIQELITKNLTDDRVFGVLSCINIEEFFDMQLILEAQEKIKNCSGLVALYGVGASLIHKGDVLVYADLNRWEIQLRYRSNENGNWLINNPNEDVLVKYKCGYFIEWRVCDKHKLKCFENMDFYLDTNRRDDPSAVTGDTYFRSLEAALSGPFRLKPYFDPGVWGGQWMKNVMDLDSTKENFAWSFDGVPEENSLTFCYDDGIVETPAQNLVMMKPRELLGEKVFARFGAEFPIRFDFLDTVGGQNLSLQVHPLTDYIQKTFGMHYTQDESYYILDAEEDSVVYLGLKESIDKVDFEKSLRAAQDDGTPMPIENYVNCFKAKKHDHFLIPAGTVHCSGKNTMVLEISATPYIFTFKLWDWGRVGLDGLPRPIHIDHGIKNIDFRRTSKWVKKNLINNIKEISNCDGILEESTGLHELEFIETRRHSFTKPVLHRTNGSVNVLNLIEGDCAIIESPSGAFKPFALNYAETVIIPECINEYTVSPYGKSKEFMTIKAYVRTR